MVNGEGSPHRAVKIVLWSHMHFQIVELQGWAFGERRLHKRML